MNKNTLLIIDLKKNFNLYRKNSNYINLNNGCINLINCNQIPLKKFSKFREDVYKKLLKKLKNLIQINSKKNFFLTEMEIFNLRNDRYVYLDRILNFLVVKKIISQKKIKNIEIISDNKSTLKIFDNLNLKIKKKDFSKSNFNQLFYQSKIIKFLIKAFCLVFFLKLNKNEKKNHINKKEFFLSIYPNKFSYGKENLFDKHNNICNFLITDETHLNFNLKNLFYYAKKTKEKKIINIERYISFYDIFLLLIKHLFYLLTFKNIKLDFELQNLSFKDELKDIFIGSYINRSKLEIYSKAIPRFLNDNNVSIMNLYLFEYSFGFFLIRTIKQFSSKIKIFGYQHGIFSNNLAWLDVINSLNFKNYYKPHKIFCLNNYSIRDYKTKYNNTKISVIDRKEKKKNNSFIDRIKIRKNSNKILILPGLHDTLDLYFYAKRNIQLNKEKNYYFKLHPKRKINFPLDKRIKKIFKFEKFSFSEVIISQTSSLHYEFLNSKRNFSIVDFDYKQNHVSSFLKKEKKVNFLKI